MKAINKKLRYTNIQEKSHFDTCVDDVHSVQ